MSKKISMLYAASALVILTSLLCVALNKFSFSEEKSKIPELILMVDLNDSTKFIHLSRSESLEIFEAIGVSIDYSTDPDLHLRDHGGGPIASAYIQEPVTIAAIFLSPAVEDDSVQLQNMLVWVNEMGEPLNPLWNDCYSPIQKRMFRAFIEGKLAALGVFLQQS